MTLATQISADVLALTASDYGGTESLTITAPDTSTQTVQGWCKDPNIEVPAEVGTVVVAERQLHAYVPVSELAAVPTAGSTVTRDGTTWKIYRTERYDPWMWRLTLYIERTEKRIPGRATLR